MLPSAVLLFFVGDQITGYMSGSNISRALDRFGLKLIAIGDIAANHLLCVQFLYVDISFAFDIAVDRAACERLMAYDISVNRAVGYEMAVNLYFKVLRSVVAIVRKGYFNWRLIWRKRRRNL